VNKIRKGDKVILNTGKDKGKQGIVLNILKNNRVVVEGLNMVKKHTKPNPAKGDQGGLVSKEMPINISNIAIYNTKSNKTDKVNFKELKDGKKIRIYKSTQEAIDV
jgi:large subunit ribosomal protein L24